MWNVTAVTSGQRSPLFTHVVGTNEPPMLAQVREAAPALANQPGYTRFLQYLDREIELTKDDTRAVSGLDAIQLWSQDAQAMANDFAATRDTLITIPRAGALGYFASPLNRNPLHPDVVAWHDHSTILIAVPPGVQQIRIEYTPEPRDINRQEWIASQFQSPAHAAETILDIRSYTGENSAVIDTWRSMRASGHGFVASMRRTGDVMVGRILRRVAATVPAPMDDPTREPRLADMRRRWPAVDRMVHDVGSFSVIQDEVEDVIVFIHGTVSCCLQSLKDLLPPDLQALPVPMYRFEHDTFHRLDANGKELAMLIDTYVRAKRIVLVGHSRGGLVGRVAMANLARRGYSGSVSLMTFGTPHDGTPVVNTVKGAVNLLMKVGSVVIDGIPILSPVVAALSHVMGFPSLPPGIEVMQDESPELSLLNAVSAPGADARCWGSKFDPATGDSGFGVDAEGVLSGAMYGIDHDLVVPTESALAYGQPQQVLNCSHVRYFEQPEVRHAILGAHGSPAAEAAQPQPGGPSVELSRDFQFKKPNLTLKKE